MNHANPPSPAATPASTGVERRQDIRYSLTESATLHNERAPSEDPGQAVKLTDFSLTGVGFATSQALQKGATYRIRIRSQVFTADVLIRIRRCEPSEGTYWIGAEFVEQQAAAA